MPLNTERPKSPRDICTVIVTFNGIRWIKDAIDSLRNSTRATHVIVVDNASSDGTDELISISYPDVDLVRNSANIGFGRANNMGIRLALEYGADRIFLLNQDAYVAPTAIACLDAFLSGHPNFGLASPIHCSPDSSTLDARTLTFYLTPYAKRYLSDACLGTVQTHYPILGINAAAWMLSKEALMSVGGFDPLYFMYREDDDYLDRLAFHNVLCALVPAARIVHSREKAHVKPAGYLKTVRLLSERARSQLIYVLKHRSRLSGKLLSLFTVGIMQPLNKFAMDRDAGDLLAYWLATARVLVEINAINRHQLLTRKLGPTFLFDDMQSG